MSRNVTVCVDTTNIGGIHTPHKERFGFWWRILYEGVDGEWILVVVRLPNDSCPLRWLEQQGMVLGVDALAERIQ